MFAEIEPAKLDLSPTRAAISILVMVFLLGVDVGILIDRQKWDLGELSLMGFMALVSALTVYRLLPCLAHDREHGH